MHVLIVFGNIFYYLNNKPWQAKLTTGNGPLGPFGPGYRDNEPSKLRNRLILLINRTLGISQVEIYFEEEPQIFCGPKLLSSFLMTTRPEGKSIYVYSIYFKSYGTVIQNMTKFLNNPNEKLLVLVEVLSQKTLVQKRTLKLEALIRS